MPELGVVPARLRLFAIYNPSLGIREEDFERQIVYSYSQVPARHARKTNADGHHQHDENNRNELLRQVGLAQGMVNFANTFSNGVAANSVETEKSRVVLHEIESGWWMLAVRTFIYNLCFAFPVMRAHACSDR